MKVTETVSESGRCDFCQIWEAEFTVNGGLWWLCKHCMKKEMEEERCFPESEEE
jgi:hypothetical protein